MVLLIIGALAAVVIPAFAGARAKAADVQAKELVRSAQTTAEAIATEDNGDYERVTAAELRKAEPTIRIARGQNEAYLSATTHAKSEYSLTATASDGTEFKVSRSSSGVITRQCISPVSKTGCGGGETATW